MTFLPVVIEAEYRDEFNIHIVFNDGGEGVIDSSEWLSGPVFEPLRDPLYFAALFVDGGTVVWPNGADVARETLYERAKSGAAA
jgi:hypothetical protein